MVSTRVRIAVACGAVALLGGACGGGGQADKADNKAPTVSAVEAARSSAAAAEATPRATDPATATSPQPTTVASPAPVSATPSVEEVQALIASMTAQLSEAAAAGPDTPAPTSDEIEAQLLEQLRLLGIPL